MDNKPELSINNIFTTWWPLALSWFLIALELPALSAIIARLADPKINLAAYGGIVLPLALMIEAPIIMLLAASTALSKDCDSYRKIRKFMHTTAGVLTACHVIIVSTPLYFFITRQTIGSPEEIIIPA
jgi:Cu/Ag efflux pump CusA